MIGFCDTETTGLPGPIGINEKHHPYITEICIAVMDEKTMDVDYIFEQLVKPPIPIPGFITKLTGIDELIVYGEPPAIEVLPVVNELFKGMDLLIMQNWTFDIKMFEIEANRSNMKIHRPPPLCMAEQTLFFKGRRMKQAELFELCFPGETYEAHRAKGDVLAMIKIYKWLRENYPAAVRLPS